MRLNQDAEMYDFALIFNNILDFVGQNKSLNFREH